MTEFLALLTAHILADFYFQPDAWVEDKRDKGWKAISLYAHTGSVILLSYVFLGLCGYWTKPHIAIGAGLVHGLIDVLKLYFDRKRSVGWFVGDQILHLISLILVAWIVAGNGASSVRELTDFLKQPFVLGSIAGLLMCLTPVSFLVGMFTRPWREELRRLAPGAEDNLDNAGRWIGMSERLLIYVFVLIGQYAAIGFLIAAKSLLRYNDKHPADIPHSYISKKSEYVLIGTLVSYTCAVLIALMVVLLK